MKKMKLLVFILLIIFLVIVFLYGIFGTGISYLSSKEIKQDRELNKSLIKNLKINNIDAIYDKNNNIYYYTLSNKHENKIYVLKLELKDGLKYKLVNETLNIIKVNYNKPINVIIYNDKYYYETTIQLTNLPLINIESEHDITNNDTESVFNYINTDSEEKIIKHNSKIHIRGASSKAFEKKSYKINMYDKNYKNEKEINMSNFYYGNSFILDAVYRDSSKIRNVLSIQLWNNISSNFSNININSEFVELFINNHYKGVYVLTEPINRRSLKLNKKNNIDTSVIIKSSSWEVFEISSEFFSSNDNVNFGYEIKYPKEESIYFEVWKKFYLLTSSYYDYDIHNNYEVIKKTFNISNYIDMIIFNSFINNSDNKMIKNNYFYMKSLKGNEIYIQPWDMEYTFGITYTKNNDINVSKNLEDYNVINTQFYHENAPEINNLLINRYWELRKDVLTKEHFDSLLDNYKNQLNKGAAIRDSELWYEYDVEKEIEDIRTWLYNRLEFFDGYVRGLENE